VKEKLALASTILTFVATIVTALIKEGSFHYAIILGIITIFCFLLFMSLKNLKKCKNFENHKIWSEIKYWKNQKIKRLRLNNPLREKLLKTCITIKIETVGQKLREFIKQNKPVNRNNIKDLISDIIDSYENSWRTMLIPEIFIEKFYEFHKPKISELNTYIDFIIDSKLYEKDEKILAIIDHFNVVLNWTILDLERANDEINGELTKQLEDLRENGDF